MPPQLRKRKGTDIDSPANEVVPPPKRAKGSKSLSTTQTPIRRVRKRGCLQELPKMPMDIIYEVSPLSYLYVRPFTDINTHRFLYIFIPSIYFIWLGRRENFESFSCLETRARFGRPPGRMSTACLTAPDFSANLRMPICVSKRSVM